MINYRLLAGNLARYGYNSWVGVFPLRALRLSYLRAYLGALGPGTEVDRGCKFLNGRKVYFGARNIINFGCTFDGRRFTIRTGDDVSIGPEAAILSLGHDPQSPNFADRGGDVILGNRVWVGYRAVILPGITIGEGAVIGAGAVVTRDVGAFEIVGGNPARSIGNRNRELTYSLPS